MYKMKKEGGDNSKGKHMIQNILHHEKMKEPSNVQSSLYVCFNNEHFPSRKLGNEHKIFQISQGIINETLSALLNFRVSTNDVDILLSSICYLCFIIK